MVRNDYVGLDVTGDSALGNSAGGILIRSDHNDIGGLTNHDDCRPCNVISGNGGAGIALAGVGTIIHGNFIGTKATGEEDVPNAGEGIVVGSGLLTTSDTTIGADGPGLARNVVSGNAGHGILVFGSNTKATTIRRNNIGRTASDFPGTNGGDGVRVALADDTTIEFNQIGGSTGDAVAVVGPGDPRVIIGGNNIDHNGDLGIDLGADGVTPNDADTADDADTGPNSLQNFPEIVSAVGTNKPTLPGNTITIDYRLQSNPDTSGIVLEFFESAGCNPGAPDSPPFGEGLVPIGSVTVDTDADGSYPASGTDTVVFSRFVPPGFVITATATGPNGTSEFSRCAVVRGVSADLALSKSVDHATPLVGSDVTFTLSVTNDGPDGATGVTVTDVLPAGLMFVSADPPAAYDQSTGLWTVGTLANGATANLEVVATVTGTTPAINGAEVSASDQSDPDSTPGNAGATDEDDEATATVTGRPPPMLSIADVAVSEGDIGTTDMTFTVGLSTPSSQSVTVHFATSGGTATAGLDYALTSGTLTFAPGELSALITVSVNGDTSFEPDETVIVTLSGPNNAGIADGTGVGTILGDDPPPAQSVSVVNDVTVAEGDSGTTAVVFTVALSSPSDQVVTVTYATTAFRGTATNEVDYIGTGGTFTFAPGELTKSATVQVLGDTLDEPDEVTYFVIFFPTNATIGDDEGVLTILDDDAARTISIADTTVIEGDAGPTDASFTVSLSGPSGQPVTVDYATTDGTASAGLDYTATSGSLTFAPGQTSRTITVPVSGDTIDEPDETFDVTLSDPAGASLADGAALATITDDDQAAISIADVTVGEGDSGSTAALFSVSLASPAGQTVTVRYSTADGTATAGLDYVAASGTLTFAPGEQAKTVSVAVSGDTTDEPDETFFVDLSGPTNGVVAAGQGSATITDDDPPVASVVNDVTVAEGDSGTTAVVFTVALSSPSDQVVTVTYATTAFRGTATNEVDYIGTGGTFTFAPGELTKSATVQVLGDTLDEPDEVTYFVIFFPTNATIGDDEGVLTILDDDAARTISIADTTVIEGDAARPMHHSRSRCRVLPASPSRSTTPPPTGPPAPASTTPPRRAA